MSYPQRIGAVSVAAMICLAAFLFFSNLSDQYLWQDEAQTALISKTILKHGVPLGYDGKNYFSQELGAEYGSGYLWKWHTWLPFYAVAISFAIFGVNTFAARLPFALCGIAAVVIVYYLSRSLSKDKRVPAISAFLLLSSVPFLILSRQSRYYSMAALFTLCCLYAYTNLLGNKRHAYAALIVSMVLLFHVHYIYYAAMAITVLMHASIFRRDALKKTVTSFLWSGVINLPWVIWLSGMKYSERYGQTTSDIGQFFMRIGSFIGDITAHIFPAYLLAVVAALLIYGRVTKRYLFKEKLDRSGAGLLSIFLCVNLLALSAASPAPFFRYLAPLIPVLYIAAAMIIASLMDLSFIAGIFLAAAVIFTNPVGGYLHEITHHYDGPVKGIVRYLEDHGDKADVVAVTYEDLPIKFYTDMRVVGGLTGEDMSPAINARWIVMRKYIICEKDHAVKKYLMDNIPWHLYKKITIDHPDTPFENSEDPSLHYYRPPLNEDRVVIYERLSR